MKLRFILILVLICFLASGCSSRKDVITMEKFDRVHVGMSWETMDSILEVPGKEMSRSMTPGMPAIPGIKGIPGIMPDIPGQKATNSILTIMWGYQNKDGSNAIFTVQSEPNGKDFTVISKAQSGL
jgi:hypothetical protein